MIGNALDAMKETGELRIYPVLHDIGNGYEGLLEGERTLVEVLEELQNERGIEATLIPKEVVKSDVTGKDDHERQLLILKKNAEAGLSETDPGHRT